MAGTASTRGSSTPSVHGNHPAGRARATPVLVASGGPVRATPLRSVPSPSRGGSPAAVGPALSPDSSLAPVLPFRPRQVGGRSARVETAPLPPLRLTRRGRRVVAGLVVAGGFGLAALVGPAVLGGGSAGGAGLALAGESSVVVQPGDTLWSIAADIAPGHDPRGVVDALQATNHLVGSALIPGQVLLVP